MMKNANRKKLATIKGKILDGQYQQMKSIGSAKKDEDFSHALEILAGAMREVEQFYGDVD
ncbi:hypothetical protein P4V47_03170 [Brevibacillus laterosporus]|uniref:hypothetical protein n=1 Tax=Brevibacillus laterosporus TaxID=1465 RepID=UPI002E1A7AED|nr:hypothetical protein [Brevibacillus laterosporus]